MADEPLVSGCLGVSSSGVDWPWRGRRIGGDSTMASFVFGQPQCGAWVI
jgi:hypothetical protein